MVLKTLHRGFLPTVFLVGFLCQSGRFLEINVADGGYSNIVIAIGDDLDEKGCDIYVANIKALMDMSSPVLYSTTGERLYFTSVTILIPDSWQTCEDVTIDLNADKLTFEDSHIRIHSPHPLFGNNPWTLQPRGCGDPGEYIYFSNEFLSTETPKWGSQATVFVHEWAKFRWGVFEEYGHLGDSIFPSAYRINASEWQPNYCTDGAINGSFESCDANTPEADCKFTPVLEQEENITSSLLAAPFLATVDSFCSKENHVASAPTKQNFLCNKESTWDVISKHPDISQTKPGQFQNNITYSIQQVTIDPSPDRIVFLLDVTYKMKKKVDLVSDVYNRWEFLRDAVRQFIMTKATDGLQIAVIPFTSTIPLIPELVTLDTFNREDLATKVPRDATSDPNKNVGQALAAAAKVLGESGKIILITENIADHKEPKLVENANGLAVQPILYPADPGLSTDLYLPVAQMNNLSPQVVNNILDGSMQTVECLVNLTRLIQTAGQSAYIEIASGISTDKKQVILEVDDTTMYETEFFIEVLSEPSQQPNFKIEGPSVVEIDYSLNATSSRIYKGKLLKPGTYTISTTYTLQQDFYASIYGMERTTSNQLPNYNIDVSASSPLSNLSFTDSPPKAPIIYATLSDGIHPIVYAEVIATINTEKSGGIDSFDLILWDTGIDGDVTGNDGTYSSYLIGVEEIGIITISVSASDNNGTAMIVSGASLNSLSAAPVDPGDVSHSCCGSILNIPDNLLTSTGTFSVSSSPGIHGKSSGSFPGANMYPPGRVTDLKGIRTDSELELIFTATGEDYNVGQASSYIVKDTLNSSFILPVNISEDVGTIISTLVSVDCDTRYSFVIEAVDSKGNPSEFSNEVHVIYSCIIDPEGLSAGAIAGIVLGCLFFIIILLVILFAICKRDKVKDSKVGFIYKCPCCMCFNKKVNNEEDKKISHLVASRVRKDDVPSRNRVPQIDNRGHIRSSNNRTPIRGVGDILRSHENINMAGTLGDKESQIYSIQRNMRLNDLRDDSSLSSSIPSSNNPMYNPSNQVGIPPAENHQIRNGLGEHDNYGYNDSESGMYNMSHSVRMIKKPILPPIQRRNLTQV